MRGTSGQVKFIKSNPPHRRVDFFSSLWFNIAVKSRGGEIGPPATPEQAHACDGGRVYTLA